MHYRRLRGSRALSTQITLPLAQSETMVAASMEGPRGVLERCDDHQIEVDEFAARDGSKRRSSPGHVLVESTAVGVLAFHARECL